MTGLERPSSAERALDEGGARPVGTIPRVGLLWWLDAAHGSYRAEGFFGQHLLVVPGEQLVAVRMKRGSDDHRPEHNFMDFADAVMEMLKERREAEG